MIRIVVMARVGVFAAVLIAALVAVPASFAAAADGARPPRTALHDVADGSADGSAARSAAGSAAGSAAPVSYSAPLGATLQVVRGFDPPIVRFGAGHLGVDLRAGAAATVRAAGPGVVSFAGPVAGRGVVVVAHADGVRTEYEPVRPLVRVGDAVARGQPLGTIDGVHRGCPGVCLHWGARRDGRYFDPLQLLRPPGVVRLLPWGDGQARG